MTEIRIGQRSNPSCQHYRIDNETARCVECNELMKIQHVEAETVLSGGPNAAACKNPACLAALEAGTYTETNPPAGCTNPDGVYIPTREETIIVGYKHSYECVRCENDGTLITSQGLEWSCGKSHRGATTSPKKEDV